jgi:exopolysaccharide biosynthesis polyprenyl glycosylphosphotransferase
LAKHDRGHAAPLVDVMQRLRRTIVLMLLVVTDLTVIAATFATSLWIVEPTAAQWGSVLEVRVKLASMIAFVGYLGFWHVVLRLLGLYRSYRLSPGAREWKDLGRAVVVGVMPLVFLREALGVTFANGVFLGAFAVLAFTGLGFERRLLRAIARGMRRRGRNLRNAIIVGDRSTALDTAGHLGMRVDLGYHVLDFVEVPTDPGADGAGAAVAARIADRLNAGPVDEVFVVLPLDTGQGLIRSVVSLCEEQGVTVRIVSDVIAPAIARARLDEIDGRPVVTVFTGPPDSLSTVAKRAIDVVVSAVALVALAPLFVILAVLIKLDSPGPVFFVQERVGLNRRRLLVCKFRSMFVGAEGQQTALEPLNEADGPVFKIRDDPRVTRVGRWLRRLSLDELPQFLNVLRGDMSLVGPRPLPVRDVERIMVGAHKRRFSVKPGITCLWQVNGREPRFQDWVKSDMEYIDNWSLALDAKILLKTIPAVLSRRGAY